MSDAGTIRRKRDLEALLERQASEPLDSRAAAYLEELLREFPAAETNEYEVAAAAVLLAHLDTSAPLPEHLAERIAARASGVIRRRD